MVYSRDLNILRKLSTFRKEKPELPTRGKGNDDMFFSDQAKNYYPEFTIAPFDVGLRFAFEVVPSLCFEMNGGKFPFGCHAWARYDRKFWEPYLLK